MLVGSCLRRTISGRESRCLTPYAWCHHNMKKTDAKTRRRKEDCFNSKNPTVFPSLDSVMPITDKIGWGRSDGQQSLGVPWGAFESTKLSSLRHLRYSAFLNTILGLRRRGVRNKPLIFFSTGGLECNAWTLQGVVVWSVNSHDLSPLGVYARS